MKPSLVSDGSFNLGGGVLLVNIAASASSALLLDHFTGADGTDLTAHTMDTGPGWTAGAGAIQISGNRATATSLAGDPIGPIYWSDAATAADGTLTVTVTSSAGGTTTDVVVRVTDANNLWQVEPFTGGTLVLYQKTAGSYTSRASGSISFATGTTHALKVVTSGATITAYWDGTQICQYTSASQGQTWTKFGLAGGGHTGQFWDDFQVTNP